MPLLSQIFIKFKLIFPDPLEEKEFARLKAPILKSSLTWLFVFIALVFVPLTSRYFDKHLSPQKYLGVAFIVCAVLVFLLRNKLEKWLELLSLIYVALMVILYIINMRLILKKQVPYEAFYMGYGLALIQRMLDFRIGTFWVIAVFHIAFHTLKFTLVEIPDATQAGLVICLEVFPLILGFKTERAERNLFDSLYNSKKQLLKFKNFLTECLPSQIVILDQNYSTMFFSNNTFNDVFKCKSIKDIKKAFKGLTIDNSTFEKNTALSELFDSKVHDNQQTMTFSQIIEFITQKKEMLQGLKDIKLQAVQHIVETSGLRHKSPTTITKETQIKEEDFILLKRQRLTDKESQRNLYTQTYNPVLEPYRMESSLEFEQLPESANQEGQGRNSMNIIRRDWHIRIVPIAWDENDAIAIVFDDVTYEKTITELQVADQNKKDLVIALISHELKTPLNGMLGMLDIVKRKLKNAEIKQTDVFLNLDACKNNSLLLLNLINSIVDFSKIKTDVLKLNYSKVNLRDLLQKITPLFEHFCRSKNLSLNFEVDADVPKTIVTDRNRLTQILISLMGNAFKFTFNGGVTVRAQSESKTSNRVRLSVEDTGIGISPKDKEKLFKLFGVVEQKNTTINTHGMGLGLTICNALARMLNPVQRGIQVESEVGKGSVFSFMIQDQLNLKTSIDSPKSDEIDGTEIISFDMLEEQRDSMSVRDKMVAYSEPKERTNLEKEHPLSILKCGMSEDLDERHVKRVTTEEKPWCLVVDDNPFNLMVAHNMMEDKGYNIMTALSGKEAIEKAQEHQKDNKMFRLILMDCQMPVMDGYESTKALKKMMSEGQISECPIVALTANAKDSKHDRLSNEAGMSGFIPKPLQLIELEKVLKDVHRQSYQELKSPIK